MLLLLFFGALVGLIAAALTQEVCEARAVIVEEIEIALADAALLEKEAAHAMYPGIAAPVQWARAKFRGPIDLLRLAKLPKPVAASVLRRIADRLEAEGM